MIRNLILAAVLLFATGCLAPKAAVDVGRDLANDAHSAAYTMAANKEASANRKLKADADKAFAELKSQYDEMIVAAAQDYGDPNSTAASRGAQSVIEYQASAAAIRARLDAKADILYREVALWKALGDVPPALVKMHDDERAFTEKAFEDFVRAGGMEAIASIFDTIEKKYLPPSLVPPPAPDISTDEE